MPKFVFLGKSKFLKNLLLQFAVIPFLLFLGKVKKPISTNLIGDKFIC